LKKDRVSIYLSEDIKNEWIRFAKNNNYSTLAKFLKEAIEFYIEYKSKAIVKNKRIDIDLLSNLSHEFKEPLTSVKAYLQFIIEEHGSSLEGDVIEMIRSAFNQCLTLEEKIIENLESFETQKGGNTLDKNSQYDILIIEDNIETVRFLTTYFKRKGVSCKGVFSGFKGLNELKIFVPKLILLDIILPDISGYEIIKRIREKSSLKEVPIFFLTAVPSVEVEKKVQELNATGAIFKPFNLEDLKILYNYLK